MTDKINLKKICCLVLSIYLIIGVAFYFIGGEQIKTGVAEGIINKNAEMQVGEILDNTEVKQEFTVRSDIINNISIMPATHGRKNRGNLFIQLSEKDNGNVLFQDTVNLEDFDNNKNYNLNLKENINHIKDKTLVLSIKSDAKDMDNSITLWSNEAKEDMPLYINGEKSEETLVLSVECIKSIWFGNHYWLIFLLTFILLVVYCINILYKDKKNKPNFFINTLELFNKYRFLLNQLVARDFKTKYKRSVLGVMWSFLNPLLTMIVQYIVFSTIFKTDIDNFPVYLLIGIVMFNFFTESCGVGLTSIVGNASLINKVYVPKYIYPIARVCSSTINLLLSLIPLFIVMILTKTPITYSILLFPFGLICTVFFALGITFILASAMVFFRDTQFLWNVISLLWMYATPLFYPESIIPRKFMFILKVNPMYHFIRFVRGIVLQGVSPEPKAYLYCILSSVITLIVGAVVFKKTQDKFVLNL